MRIVQNDSRPLGCLAPSLHWGKSKEQKKQRAKGNSVQAATNTQTHIVEKEARPAPVTEGGANEPCIIVPATATQNTVLSRSSAVRIRDVIPGIIATPIPAPLPDIAMHVVKAPRVCLLRPNGMRFLCRIGTVPRVLIEFSRVVAAIPREEGKRAIAEGLTVRDSWLCDFDGQDGDIIVRRSVSTPFFEALRERCETIFQGTGAVGTKNLHEPFRTELIRISVGVHGLNNAIRVEKQPISRLHAEAVFLEMLVFDANRTVTLNS